MRARLAGLGLVAALGLIACGARAPRLPADEMSGFLDDYSRLAPGGPDQPSFVYRDPQARWGGYERILFEPVTIWRSGRGSLADIPGADLERLAFELQRSVRAQLERHFELVDRPGPGVLRVRLGLTQARQADPLLDIFTYAVPPMDDLPADEPLTAATRGFVAAAAVEGELSDTVTGTLLAAGVDRRRTHELRTWAGVRAAADRWAAWFAGRLERARRGGLR